MPKAYRQLRDPIDLHRNGTFSQPTMNSEHLSEVARRFPLLDQLGMAPEDSHSWDQPLPQFIGLFLSALTVREEGGVCIVVPSKGHLPFVVASVFALSSLKRCAPTIAIDLLRRVFHPGQLVRLAPEGYVYEFDGYFPYEANRFFRLRIPESRDSVVHSLSIEQAFRLSPVTDRGRRAPLNRPPSPAPPTAIDRLLNLQTGGNTAPMPNLLLFLSGRAKTRQLAETTEVGLRGIPSDGVLPASVMHVLTWGRIADGGELISEDKRDAATPPIVAVTHSLENLVAACENQDNRSPVVIDGVINITDSEALQSLARSRRTVVIADYSETRFLPTIRAAGYDVWAPHPGILLSPMSRRDGIHPLLTRCIKASENVLELELTSRRVQFEQLEDIVVHLQAIEKVFHDTHVEEPTRPLIGGLYGLVTRICEWVIPPDEQILSEFEDRLGRVQNSAEELSGYMLEETQASVANCIDLLKRIGLDPNTGEAKSAILFDLLGGQEDPKKKKSIVVRTPGYARYLQEILASLGEPVETYAAGIPHGKSFHCLILGSWLSKRHLNTILGEHAARSIVAITYPFEDNWFQRFRAGRCRALNSLALDEKLVVAAVGVGFPSVSFPVMAPDETEEVDDPVTSILETIGSRKKGPANWGEIGDSSCEARYVDCYGPTYSYLTSSHKVPVVTELVHGLAVDRVPMRSIENIAPGDYLLFRDHGDRDIISFIAQESLGEEQYERELQRAHQWRRVLRTLGSTTEDVYQCLKRVGLDKTKATIHNWLWDESIIGPGSDKDLDVIAIASDDRAFIGALAEIQGAIRVIRGAHIQAGFRLSNLLLKEIPEKLEGVDLEGTLLDLTFGNGWIVCVRDIADTVTILPSWEANRLLWDEGF